MWKLLYNYDFGIFNQALVAIGAQPANWLGSPSLALIAAIVAFLLVSRQALRFART
jgi:multiple sugar transport system permease protein